MTGEVTFSREQVRDMIEETRAQASDHNGDYAAGIRFACVELEEAIYE